MRILILITKDKKQILKLVEFKNLSKGAKGKISHLNKDTNIAKLKNGDINKKFNFMQAIFTKKFGPDFSLKGYFGMYSKSFINCQFSFFNMEEADIKKNYLESEYYRQISKNKHQVLQYNLTIP